MIFWQSIFDNFWTTFSLILTWCCYHLSSFFSLHCFWPIKSEKNKIVSKVVIKWMSKYHYSFRKAVKYYYLLKCEWESWKELLEKKEEKGKEVSKERMKICDPRAYQQHHPLHFNHSSSSDVVSSSSSSSWMNGQLRY
jgi:hypothetical protein